MSKKEIVIADVVDKYDNPIAEVGTGSLPVFKLTVFSTGKSSD